MRVDVDELMGEMGWVRQLARNLLRDGDAANEVAQEAFLVATTHPPEEGRPLRPWLYRVVTNLVRMRRRSAGRRSARELAVGGDFQQTVPTSDELVERVETQRVLAAEVIALAEPYRSTVLLHYVEGLSSADIARRLGIPSATVRRRLKHALDELRDRLRARDDGPKRGWLAALIPIARTPSSIGVLAMKKVIATIALLALLLIGGSVAVWKLAHRTGSADHSAIAHPIVVASRSADSAVRTVTLPSWLSQGGVLPRRVAGRVIFNGQPATGATVRLGIMIGDPFRRTPTETSGPFAQLASVETNALGEFDFGVLPATNFIVSAEKTGAAPVSLSVALADPHAPADHLVMRLGDCRSRMSGTVRDAGAAIAFARIKISGLGGVTTAQDGTYALCVPGGRVGDLRVEADGYGSIAESFTSSLYGVLHRDFTLVPEGTIEGRVVDEAGAAVAAALVDARNLLSDGKHQVATGSTVADETGTFHLSGVAPGKYTLTAIAARSGTDVKTIVTVVAGIATRDVTLTVQHRARIRGRVTMQGQPIAGAHVSLAHHTFSGRGESAAETQLDGSFVLDGVQRGPTELNVSPYDVTAPTSLAVDRDELEVTIEVSARAAVYGRITRHREPVADAAISCSSATRLGATSDASGEYVLEDLPAGAAQLLAASPRAFVSQSVALVAGERKRVDLELEGGGAIRGVVVDEIGAAVPTAFVRFATASGDECQSMTDSNGAFACEALSGHHDYQPAVYPSFAQQRPYEPAQGSKLAPVHVEDGDTTVDHVTLAIKRDRLAITGIVVDDTKLPIADAHVVIDYSSLEGPGQRSTRTDASGAFTLDELVAGTYDLRAHTSDGSEGTAPNVAAGTTATIQLVRSGRVEGTLVGFTTPPWVFADTAASDSDKHDAVIAGAHFTFTGLPVGHYQIVALQNGVQMDGAAVDVRSGSTSTLSLRAKPRAMVHGRVLDFTTGAPVVGMTCRAEVSIGGNTGPDFGFAPPSALTDATGTFSISAPIGRDRIECFAPGLGSWSDAGGDFEVSAETNLDVRAVHQIEAPSDPGITLLPETIPATVERASSPLVAGDQLLAVDGVAVSNIEPSAVAMLMGNHAAGSVVIVQVLRAGAPLTLRVVTR